MQLPGCGKTNFNIYEFYMWELHFKGSSRNKIGLRE